MKTFHCILIIFFLTLGLSLGGCASDTKARKAVDVIKEKQKNYDELIKALAEGALRKGTPAVTIKTLYGNPDDTFASGSMTGSTDIWTYHKIPDPKTSEEAKAVRLYFSNSKLIDWTY